MRVLTTGKRSTFDYDKAKGALEVIGDITLAQGLRGQQTRFKQATGLFDIAVSGSVTISTVTATTVETIVPANALILAVTSRVITTLTGATGTWKLGVLNAIDRYGSGLALTAGTTSNMADHLVTVSPIYVATAVALLFTSSVGTWTGGSIRCTIHYLTCTAATS